MKNERPGHAEREQGPALLSQQILDERARRLALQPQQEEAGERLDIVVFTVGGERYGIEYAWVCEVRCLDEWASVPCAPPFVCGAAAVGRRIVPVVDLLKLIGTPERRAEDITHVVVLHGEGMEFGIFCESVVGTVSIRVDDLQQSLPTLKGPRAEFLKGVTADRMVVLDGRKLLASKRIVVNEQVQS